MHRDFLGVSILRWALAASGLGAGLVAVVGALTRDPVTGWCLRHATSDFGHCGWCYLGVALLVTAAAPWPRVRRIPVRSRVA